MRRATVMAIVLVNLLSLLSLSACAAVGSGDGSPGGDAGTPAAAPGTDAGAVAQDAEGAVTPEGVAAEEGVLLLGLGVHIEPLGAEVSPLVAGEAAADPKPSGSRSGAGYTNSALFERHIADLGTLAGIVEAHGGVMTLQAQSPFTTVAAGSGNQVLAELADAGHEIGLHFHEDAHLGPNPEELPAETWCSVMKEEISLIEQVSGVSAVRFFSGGNLYPELLEAASCAGLDINSDWKNPREQTTAGELIGTNPWRPAGGSNGNDVSRFAAHDAGGAVIYLPDGRFSRTTSRKSGTAASDEAYFESLRESLVASLAEAQADPGRVHVFHLTVHPGEFRGDPENPFAVIEEFLAGVVDPLVASGQVEWATFSEMADAYAAWEQSHPGQDPLGSDLQ